MQHINNYLLALHSLELKTIVEDGQAFLSLEHYEESTKYEVELERMRLLVVNELIGLDEVKLQYQINNFGLIYNKFITHFDYQTERKYLLWLVQKEEPTRFDHIEEDEDIQLFIKNRIEPGDIAPTWEEILLWAETFLHIERDMTDIPYKVKSVRAFYYRVDTRIRVSIASLDKLIFDIETITNKKPTLFKTNEQIADEQDKYKNYENDFTIIRLNHNLKPTQIVALYEALKGNYITSETTLKDFQALFDSKVTEMVTPINWTDSNRLLVYLLEKIFKSWKTHFERKKAFYKPNGEPMKAGDYSSALSDTKWGKPRGYEQIDSILDSIRKQNA